MASISFNSNNQGLQIGVHNGPVNMPPERSETPTNPLSTVPFARDRHFVSRDTLLRQIREEGLIPGSRIALVGLGGVGKSQLAIEYSYQVRSQSPATWVFWVHASNQARLEQSFRDLAGQVQIPGRQDPNVNIFQLVENWLRNEKRKWVCILDNVDDDQLLNSYAAVEKGDSTRSPTNASKPLLEYIPRSPNGYVIITSRSREVALKMVDTKSLVEVRPMANSESLELLRRKLEFSAESQECQQLVSALEFMPLAIVQAASYIQNRAPRCSVSQYLRDFQKSDHEAIKLLKKEAGHLGRDWEAKNSILMTWQMSFDYIRQRYPSAADLLSLMSFFDRQSIPESLIRHQPAAVELEGDSGETSESDSGPDFEDDITTLRHYSFISISEDATFTMHRLVQITTRAWLKSHGQLDRWKDTFTSTLYKVFPNGHYENWEKCRPLFPHVKSAISQRPTSPKFQRQWASILHRGASYALNTGNHADAREMALKSKDERTLLLGNEHNKVLSSTKLLAKVYRVEGRWDEAEQLEVRVLEARRAKLGKDHPNTLLSMANLAKIYTDQNRLEEAEQLEVQVLEASRAKLGEDHPDTLSSMANLAATYASQNRWEKAEKLEVQVLEASRVKLGEDHPDTLSSMANLAATYADQGRWEEAEKLEVPVLEARRAKLGEDHPNTLMSMANLAVTYAGQRRWREAEKLEVRVLEASKVKLGEDHPNTLMCMSHLAYTWKAMGRNAEAIILLRNCVAKQNKILGSNHPDALSNSDTLLQWEAEGLNMGRNQLDT